MRVAEKWMQTNKQVVRSTKLQLTLSRNKTLLVVLTYWSITKNAQDYLRGFLFLASIKILSASFGNAVRIFSTAFFNNIFSLE